MSIRIKIRPTREGLKVPFPMSRRFLSHDGEMVDKSSYWIKRMLEGDVEQMKDSPIVEKVIKADGPEQIKQVKKINKSTKKLEVKS